MAGSSPWASRRSMFFGQESPAVTHGFNKASAHALLSGLRKLQDSTDKMATLRSGEQAYKDGSRILDICIQAISQAALSSNVQAAPKNNQGSSAEQSNVSNDESVSTHSLK